MTGSYYHCCLNQEFHPSEFDCSGYNDPNLFLTPNAEGLSPWIRYLFFEDVKLENQSDICELVTPYRDLSQYS